MTSTKDIYWLAGLLEGEGSFGSVLHRYPRIHIKMNDKDVVEHALRILKPRAFNKSGFELRSHINPGRMGSASQYFQTAITGTRAVGWMMMLYPLMGKRRQAQIRVALERWRVRHILLLPKKTTAGRLSA